MTPHDFGYADHVRRQQTEYRTRHIAIDAREQPDCKRYAVPRGANTEGRITAWTKVRAALHGRHKQAGALLCVLLALMVVFVLVMAL